MTTRSARLLTFNRRNRGTKDEPDTVLLVELLEEAGDRFRRHPAHHAVLELQHRDLASLAAAAAATSSPM